VILGGNMAELLEFEPLSRSDIACRFLAELGIVERGDAVVPVPVVLVRRNCRVRILEENTT